MFLTLNTKTVAYRSPATQTSKLNRQHRYRRFSLLALLLGSGTPIDVNGGLYGTTSSGGKYCTFGGLNYCGTVYASGTTTRTQVLEVNSPYGPALDATNNVYVADGSHALAYLCGIALALPWFLVRESQAGHSTVTFDDRVIGSELGKSTQRIAIATAAEAGPLIGATVLPQRVPASVPVRPPVLPH